MPTKAELEAELAALKQELAERAQKAAEETAPKAGRILGEGPAALAEMLKSHGIDPTELDLERLWPQLSADFGTVFRTHPALTAVTVFALGFLLGRASK